MSFNANTVYPAVDINTIANQCKEAINADAKCFIVVGLFGDIHGVFRDYEKAAATALQMNRDDADAYWTIEEHNLQ
jgi:hypothetical protein